jgi:hypothetical protein
LMFEQQEGRRFEVFYGIFASADELSRHGLGAAHVPLATTCRPCCNISLRNLAKRLVLGNFGNRQAP